MYQNPAAHLAAVDGHNLEVNDADSAKHFEEFYEDVFYELSKFGNIDTMQACLCWSGLSLTNIRCRFVTTWVII
jgi:hypothetical protein